MYFALSLPIASCPFVTTVGGTIHVNPEVAVDFSGGGFSNYFAQPRYAASRRCSPESDDAHCLSIYSYQATAVSTFLQKLGRTNAGLFKWVSMGYSMVIFSRCSHLGAI